MFMNDGFAFSTLLNILPQGAFRINLAQKSRFDFVNESLAAMLGYTID